MMDLNRENLISFAEKLSLTVRFLHWHECTGLRAGTGLFPLISCGKEDLPAVLRFAKETGLTLFPLGGGTNLAGSDRNFSAIGLKVNEKEFTLNGGIIRADAGIPLGVLASRLPDHGLGGLAPLSGIPGTLGGAVRMNAGANGHSLSEFLIRIVCSDLKTGEVFDVSGKDPGWGYRTSPVPENALVLSADLLFPEADPEREREAVASERARRKRVTPAGGSAGSVFRNPSPDRPAGRLIESCGCKGMTCGAFRVSEQHANWIVNPEFRPAPSGDCLSLMRQVQETVFRQTGIALEPEWKIVP